MSNPHDWDVCGSTAPQTLTYHGKPCRHCGGTLRYRAWRQCVKCSRDLRARGTRAPQGGPQSIVVQNTIYALYYPEELERTGTRRVAAQVAIDEDSTWSRT